MLGKCVACEKDVSNNASVCPHCGEPDPLNIRTNRRASAQREAESDLGAQGALITIPGAAALGGFLGYQAGGTTLAIIGACVGAGLLMLIELRDERTRKNLLGYLIVGAIVVAIGGSLIGWDRIIPAPAMSTDADPSTTIVPFASEQTVSAAPVSVEREETPSSDMQQIASNNVAPPTVAPPVIVAPPPGANVAPTVDGHWIGEYCREGGRCTRLDMTISSSDTRLIGTATEPRPLGAIDLGLNGTIETDGSLTFTTRFEGGFAQQYSGVLSEGGDVITGRWQRGSRSGEFRLQRDASVPPKLQ